MELNSKIMIKIVRSSKHIDTIYEVAKKYDLLYMFLNLSTEGRESFIIIIRELKKLKSEELLENEKTVLEKFDQMTDYLISKCKDKTLSDEETKFLLMLLANALIDNTKGLDEIINFYFNNYYFKNKKYYIGEEIVLINNYIINFLNQLNNSQIELKYVSSKEVSSHASIRRKEAKTEFLINKDLYLPLITIDQIPEKDYYSFLTYQVFCIMHEFYHNKQFDGFDNDKLNVKEIKEYIVAFHSYNFYSKYHDNFKFEQDADQFAIKSTKIILKGIIPPDVLETTVENLKFGVNKIHSKDLDRTIFQKLIDDEYIRLCQDPETTDRKNI